MKHGCLIVSCAHSQLALPVESVVEVARMVAPCAKLLRAPRYVMGIVDFHGQLVPLVDLPARLGLCAPRTPTAMSSGHIVFLELPSGLWGMAVDGVQDLSREPVTALSLEPKHLSGLLLGSLRLADGERALVLNPSQILSVVMRARIGAELLALSKPSQPEGGTA